MCSRWITSQNPAAQGGRRASITATLLQTWRYGVPCFAGYKTHSEPVRTVAAVVDRLKVFQLLTMSVATDYQVSHQSGFRSRSSMGRGAPNELSLTRTYTSRPKLFPSSYARSSLVTPMAERAHKGFCIQAAAVQPSCPSWLFIWTLTFSFVAAGDAGDSKSRSMELMTSSSFAATSVRLFVGYRTQ